MLRSWFWLFLVTNKCLSITPPGDIIGKSSNRNDNYRRRRQSKKYDRQHAKVSTAAVTRYKLRPSVRPFVTFCVCLSCLCVCPLLYARVFQYKCLVAIVLIEMIGIISLRGAHNACLYDNCGVLIGVHECSE